jgi:zinc protease
VNLRSLMEEDKLEVALANFRRVLVEPDFPEQALERQRKRFLIGIQHKQQSPGAIAGDAFMKAVYGDHPYGHPAEGTAESVQRFTREAVVDFHRRHYVAANAIIVMVGDLDRAKAAGLAEDLAEALPEGAAPPPPPAAPSAPAEREVRINHPSTQMHILMGQPGMRVNDPDYFPLYVGNHVLGGSGLVSRLFEEIRNERGLSYSTYSYFTPRRVAGPFTAGLQTRADQAEEALKVLRGEIARFIEEGPTAKELEAAKKNITGGFPLRLDSNSDILGYTALIAFYGLPLDFLDTYTAKVEAVTAEQIRDAFRRRLDPDRMATVMVGPVEAQGSAAAPGD